MKTLPAILQDVMILLADPRIASVVIARGNHDPLDEHSSAFQMRLRLEGSLLCEARVWLGLQWSIWREPRGWLGGGSFDASDVLATDWRIVS